MSKTNKLSDLRKFLELEEFKKNINHIHRIRLWPDFKLLFKLEPDQIRNSISD